MTRIFDVDGSEKDADWLAAQYDGCTVLPADTTGAAEAWRLMAVFVTEGPAVLKVEARNKTGQAVSNQPVVMTYPNLANPSGGLDDLTGYSTRWADRGKTHRTNADGVMGFGLGGTYGPFYHAWVLSSAPSDLLHCAGMKGGTNHRGPLHGVWQLEDVEPAHVDLKSALLWNAEKAQVIQFNPSAALQKRIFADGFVPNSPEFDLAFDGVDYVAQRAEHMGSGEVRVYYCMTSDYDTVLHVTRR